MSKLMHLDKSVGGGSNDWSRMTNKPFSSLNTDSDFSVDSNNKLSLNSQITDKLSDIDYAYENGFASKNLIDFDAATTSYYNVTYTNNGDGTYTVDGTASGTSGSFSITRVFSAGTYKIVGCPTNSIGASIEIKNNNSSGTGISRDAGSGATFSLTNETTLYIYIRIPSGKTAESLLFKPMIVDADVFPNVTYDDYTEYALSNVEVTNRLSASLGSTNADGDEWVTSKAYVVGDMVIVSNVLYYCKSAHTSSTWSTDLTNYWEAVSLSSLTKRIIALESK